MEDLTAVLQCGKNAVMWDALPRERKVSFLLSIPDLAKLYKSEGFQGSFIDFLKLKITDEMMKEIFNETKQQHLCPLWRQQRVGALTASTLHGAARYSRSDPDNYMVKIIMGESKFLGNTATDYGQKYEPVARKLYEEAMKSKHQQLMVKSSGLFVSKDIPLLRASPDALVSCQCCGKGLLEIKCPFSQNLQTKTAEEIAAEGKYHLKIGINNNVELKQTSTWYTQIQAQLFVTQYSWCDFVVFTQKKPHITTQRIFFKKDRFEADLQRALAFHEKYIMPKLMQ